MLHGPDRLLLLMALSFWSSSVVWPVSPSQFWCAACLLSALGTVRMGILSMSSCKVSCFLRLQPQEDWRYAIWVCLAYPLRGHAHLQFALGAIFGALMALQVNPCPNLLMVTPCLFGHSSFVILYGCLVPTLCWKTQRCLGFGQSGLLRWCTVWTVSLRCLSIMISLGCGSLNRQYFYIIFLHFINLWMRQFFQE